MEHAPDAQMKTYLRIVLLTLLIGGGFTGFSLTFATLIDSRAASFAFYFFGVFSLILYGFATFSGLLFAINRGRTKPLYVALALQVPYLSSTPAIYQFGIGFPVFLSAGPATGAERAGFSFNWNVFLGSSWKFSVALPEEVPLRVGVNATALVLLILLWRAGVRSSVHSPHLNP